MKLNKLDLQRVAWHAEVHFASQDGLDDEGSATQLMEA